MMRNGGVLALILAFVMSLGFANESAAQSKWLEKLKKKAEKVVELTVDEVPETPDETATQTDPVLNNDPNMVRAAQQELFRLGYQVTVDGAYRSGTAAAIRAFESSRGLPQNGNVTIPLLQSLRQTPTPPPAQQARLDPVQQSGSDDASYPPASAFQRTALGLPVFDANVTRCTGKRPSYRNEFEEYLRSGHPSRASEYLALYDQKFDTQMAALKSVNGSCNEQAVKQHSDMIARSYLDQLKPKFTPARPQPQPEPQQEVIAAKQDSGSPSAASNSLILSEAEKIRDETCAGTGWHSADCKNAKKCAQIIQNSGVEHPQATAYCRPVMALIGSSGSSTSSSNAAPNTTKLSKSSPESEKMPEYIPMEFLRMDLLQLKLRPDLFTEDQFLELTKTLIKSDQKILGKIEETLASAKRMQDAAEASPNEYNKGKALAEAEKHREKARQLESQLYFREDQVRDRNPDFIYRLLTPETYSRVMKAVQFAPTKFRMVFKLSVSGFSYDFENQKIHYKPQRGGEELRPEIFFRLADYPEARPEMGKYVYLISRASRASGEKNPFTSSKWKEISKDLPEGARRRYSPGLPVGGMHMFASPVRLDIPAISSPPEKAEQQLRQLTRAQLMGSLKGDKQADRTGYFLLEFFGEVVDVQQDPITKSNVPIVTIESAELFDQFGEKLLTLSGSDLPSAETEFAEKRRAAEVAQAKAIAEQAARKAEEAKRKAEEAKRKAEAEEQLAQEKKLVERSLEECATRADSVDVAACRAEVICNTKHFSSEQCNRANAQRISAERRARAEELAAEHSAYVLASSLESESSRFCKEKHRDLRVAPLGDRTPAYKEAQAACMKDRKALEQTCLKNNPFQKYAADRPYGSQEHYDAILVCMYEG